MVLALKTSAVILASVFLATLVVSCSGDTHEKIVDDTLTQMEEVATVIEGVKDKESAEAAAKKLEGMVGTFEKLAERMKEIGDPDEKTEKELEAKMETRMKELQEKMTAAMMSAASKDPAVISILQAPMEKIGKAMEEVN